MFANNIIDLIEKSVPPAYVQQLTVAMNYEIANYFLDCLFAKIIGTMS